MVIANSSDFEQWITGKRREWAVTIAARAAARALPATAPISQNVAGVERWQDNIVLPVLRAVFISVTAAKHQSAKTTQAATAAAKAAGFAAATAISSTSASAISSGASDAAYSARAAADAAAVPDATQAATTATRAAGAARAGVWHAVNTDSLDLQKGIAVTRMPLWPEPIPVWAEKGWRQLKSELLRTGSHWSVWTTWYEDILVGESHAAAVGRPEILERSLEIASISDADWKRGSEHVNTIIAAINIRYWGRGALPSVTIEEIEEVASPSAILNSENVLDLQANPVIDQPDKSPDVARIPEIQTTLIGVMLEGLPGNTPKGLLSALAAYRNEFDTRKMRPILGTLTTLHMIAMAERHDTESDLWLPPGMKVAFQQFDQHHKDFVKHFPLLEKREAVISRIAVDKTKTQGDDLIAPFRQALRMAKEANEAGVATEDVLKFIEHLKQTAETIAHLPEDMEISFIADIDRIPPAGATPKQRLLGGAIGYLEKAYNLTGTTVTLGTASYPALAENIGRVLRHLKDMAGL